MTFGSLFAGIGGFDLGLERAGMRCAWQVEKDNWCQRVLAKHWPNVPRYGDITKLDYEELERADVICGGFPCQPFSSAGNRSGEADDRFLWPAMFEVIQHVQPAWVIGENVYGLVAGEMEPVFERVCSDLEGEGYDVQAFVIPACAVDAKHRRDRVWIIGYSNQHRESSRSLNDETPIMRKAIPHNDQQRKNAPQQRHGEIPSGYCPNVSNANGSRAVADCHSTGLENGQRRPSGQAAQRIPTGSRSDVSNPTGQQMGGTGQSRQNTGGITGRITEPGVGGMAYGVSPWMDEPRIPRIAKGIPGRVNRLRGLGNAIVPDIAEWLGRFIIETERKAV